MRMGIRTWLLLALLLALLAGCAEPSGLLRPPETTSPVDAGAALPAAVVLEATPVPCSDVLTSADQEGPYYTPGSPQRASLIEDGMAGMPILIFGHVFDPECRPIAGAVVDFWQTDANGVYDNAGYTLRGHVMTDDSGAYAVETIEPGVYPGRPPHIHVKVFGPDGRELLTTQMYFGGRGNGSPGSDLLVPYLGQDEEGRQQVSFDFVVNR